MNVRKSNREFSRGKGIGDDYRTKGAVTIKEKSYLGILRVEKGNYTLGGIYFKIRKKIDSSLAFPYHRGQN